MITRAANATEMLSLEIWRGAEEGAFRTYYIPMRAQETVLDAVSEVQRTADSTLAYRFACRVGMCGSCAMMVNERPRWTCRTRVGVAARNGRIRLAPLRHLPVVKDLVVDMAPFFAKWQQAQGRFEPGGLPSPGSHRAMRDGVPGSAQWGPGAGPAADFARVPPASPERQAADAGIECIGCGVCYAACDVVGWDKQYLGPAALNRAWTLVNDVRDAKRGERLRSVSGPGGCASCHTHMACSETCPKGIAPTYAIAGLKRLAMRAALGVKP